MRPFSAGEENATEKTAEYPQLVEDPQPLGDVMDLPRELERVVMACLQRDPQRRPRSAIDVAVALHGVLEGLRVEELYAWPRGLRVRPDPR